MGRYLKDTMCKVYTKYRHISKMAAKTAKTEGKQMKKAILAVDL